MRYFLCMMNSEDFELEYHPFAPFVPEGARVLFMGTFPPQPKRWAMEFYYPNRTNDFWPMMGLIFYGDRRALFAADGRSFDLERIKGMLTEHHIAMSDTGHAVRRLRNNASDKFLEIVEPVDLPGLLARMPECRAIATTGEKAAEVIAQLTGTEPPKMGARVEGPAGLSLWRMPSTSRAYPLALERKADYYRELLRSEAILTKRAYMPDMPR